MATAARAPLRIDLAGGWTDVPAFADAEGGAVVNVAIDRYVQGEIAADDVRITRDVEASGLGSSAAEHVLAYALRHPEADLDGIAEAAFASETAGSIAGGRQDQYAACYGGLSFMSFGRDAGGAPVHIERLEMPEAHLAALQKRLVLVDSGVARLSGEIHDAVWASYARHDDEVTGALLALKQYGRAMRDAIAGSDFGGSATCSPRTGPSRNACTRPSRTTRSMPSSDWPCRTEHPRARPAEPAAVARSSSTPPAKATPSPFAASSRRTASAFRLRLPV